MNPGGAGASAALSSDWTVLLAAAIQRVLERRAARLTRLQRHALLLDAGAQHVVFHVPRDRLPALATHCHRHGLALAARDNALTLVNMHLLPLPSRCTRSLLAYAARLRRGDHPLAHVATPALLRKLAWVCVETPRLWRGDLQAVVTNGLR